MESTDSWNLLTASLAVCDLGAPFSAWAFLVIQCLVRDMPGDREAFADFVAESLRYEREHGPTTGASLARRAADFLIAAGATLPPSEAPDPGGEIAISRLSGIVSWGNLDFDRDDRLEHFPEWSKRPHRSQSRASTLEGAPSTADPAASVRKRPWWRRW
jgi:hypothetical protein